MTPMERIPKPLLLIQALLEAPCFPHQQGHGEHNLGLGLGAEIPGSDANGLVALLYWVLL